MIQNKGHKILHKKQPYQLLERTIKWNTDRGNTPDTLDWNLEQSMLQEELDELNDATTEVDKLDALLDIIFVATGSLSKLGLSAEQIVDATEIVVSANEAKGSKKDSNGKIIKNNNFVPPEPELQLILEART